MVLQSPSQNKHIFDLRIIIRVIIGGGGSYLQAPMESFDESCELKQQIQGKKTHIYATLWFDSFVRGHPDAAI